MAKKNGMDRSVHHLKREREWEVFVGRLFFGALGVFVGVVCCDNFVCRVATDTGVHGGRQLCE